MHDLNTINRLNAEADVGQAITRERSAGKHVVARYTGLHLTHYSVHETADEMVDALAKARSLNETGVSYKALPATVTVTA